ncbi:MAG: VWA domain-containing protein [Pseudomonadota bacterium]|nr:VWA domain-containing protein [Pseudomonadota bacterium]
MRHKRRGFSAVSLAFLDIMSCGFGAVVLLFLIIKHQTDVAIQVPEYDLSVEVDQIRQQIGDAETVIGRLESQSRDTDSQITTAKKRAQAIKGALKAATSHTRVSTTGNREIDALKATLRRMETDRRNVQAQIYEKSRDVRTFVGEGNREYLTGIQLGGRRILILLDASASMLDDTIVNIIRRRNMDDATKRNSRKWRQALATVDWITARFPAQSQYQIYTFSTKSKPVLATTRGRWLPVSDNRQLNDIVAMAKDIVPQGGSSLERAFLAITQLSPRPDNVFLVTDGLPTQGLNPPRGTTVSGRERLKLFESAVTRIPRGIPINVILLEMEGDPMAPSAFWQIALYTKGAFLSPARDWP